MKHENGQTQSHDYTFILFTLCKQTIKISLAHGTSVPLEWCHPYTVQTRITLYSLCMCVLATRFHISKCSRLAFVSYSTSIKHRLF
jgi:hypothetical protein